MWPHVAVLGNAGEQVMDLVNHGVLPSDDVAVRPPVLPERVGSLGDEHGAKPLCLSPWPRAGEVHLEFVEALQVERDRALGAVDLKGESVPARAFSLRPQIETSRGASGGGHVM